jgi:uncharacterized protein YcaQ
MKATNISNQLARELVLKAQLLDNTMLSADKAGALEVIQKLGYIQIDTIAVVKRAHHQILWSRCPDYRERSLHELQAKDRQVFEYWGHAMSYLPMCDYRYSLPRMQNFENPSSPWAKYQFQECRNLLEPVLKQIREEGPLSSSDFKPPPGKKAGGWWDWKPAKVALELLFWQGKLMISERQNFKKIYDLTERVLPDDIDSTMPTKDELGQFIVCRALSALGIAEEREIMKFLQPESSRDADIQIVGKEQITLSLRHMEEKGEIIQLKLENNDDSVYYVFPESLQQESPVKKGPPRLQLLSPFDNMIIQRDRLKRLFGFDYSLECYLPVKKRRYGYFSLPILWGNNFVGRLDPKADRERKTMIIKNLIFESGFRFRDEFLEAFTNKLIAFAQFNNCLKIKTENVNPKKYTTILNSIINRQYDLV